MLVKSKQAFNAMGIISAEAGKMFDIDSPYTVIQLKEMGFIEVLEEDSAKTKKRSAKAND
jgi:hypothetical protein